MSTVHIYIYPLCDDVSGEEPEAEAGEPGEEGGEGQGTLAVQQRVGGGLRAGARVGLVGVELGS